MQPLEGCRAGLFAEAAVEGSGARAGPVGDVLQGQVPVRVLLQPGEQRFHRRAGRCRWLGVDDELGLAALPFERHHRQPGRVRGDGRAVVPADHVQAHVEGRGRARRGEELAVVDIEDVRVDGHRGVQGRQVPGREPVGRGAQSVQQAGGGQDEGADADRGDPGAVRGRGAQCLGHTGRQRSGGVLGPGQDDRVRLGQRLQPVRGAQRERARVDLPARLDRTDPDPVRRPTVRQARPAEGVDRGGEVERDHLVERQYGNGVHGQIVGVRRIVANSGDGQPASAAVGRGSHGTSAHRPVRQERAPGDSGWRESVGYWQKCHFCKIQDPHSVTP